MLQLFLFTYSWSQLPTKTPDEPEILVLISTGKSSKEIGNQLSLSIRTKEKHRENILNKLGAKNTAQLISKTYRQIG